MLSEKLHGSMPKSGDSNSRKIPKHVLRKLNCNRSPSAKEIVESMGD
jgi:hypothetical protein